MKKLLFVFSLFALLLAQPPALKAQVSPLLATFSTTTQVASGIDSTICANTATVYLYSNVVAGTPEYVEVVANITKVSGTLGGTMTFQGSHDGIVWDIIGTAFTVTDATQVKTFGVAKNANAKKFYRLKWAGTGTMNGYVDATISVKY